MKVTEVRVSFSYTKNLGNFESVRVEAGATAELETKENAEEVFPNLFELAKQEVKKQVAQHIRERKKEKKER